MPKKLTISGFTLLEVMIAMILLSIMVTLLFASLQTGAESWDKGEKKIAEVNEKAVVYQFFNRHMPSIRPLWDNFSDSEKIFSFQGSSNTFQFVSIFPASAGRKGLQLFEVGSDRVKRGVIKVILKPFYPEIEGQQWEKEEVVLLENVETFELTYLDNSSTNDKAIWVDQWQEKEHLPALIKIKITLVDHSYWPEMVFALKLITHQPVDSEENVEE